MRKNVFLKGERFVEDSKDKSLTMVLREFWIVAGKPAPPEKPWGWLGEGSLLGLSISKPAIQHCLSMGLKIIRVVVGNNKEKAYETTVQTWLDFVHEHQSFDKRGGTLLYVIQFSSEHFTTVLGDFSKL